MTTTMAFSRRVLSGTIQLTLSSGVMRLLSIVTMPILTGVLNPTAYGVATLVGTVISLVSVLALAGIDMSYRRAYYSTQPPSGEVVEHYCWRFAMAAGMVSGVLAAVMWWYVIEMDLKLAILLATGIIGSVASAMTQSRALLAGRYRAIAVTTIIAGGIVSAASIGIAIWWRRDAMALILPMVLSYLLPVLLLGMPSIAGLLKPSGLPPKAGVALVKIGIAGVVTAPLYWLLSSSDRWFLQYYHGSAAVGVYSLGYSVAGIGGMVNSAVMSVWLPEASREFERDQEQAQAILGRLVARLLTAMAVIWLIVAAAGGDIVRLLANERFHASAEFVPFIAGGVFFYGTSQLIVFALLLVKQYKWAALWWFVGGVVCTLLNIVMVPRWGGLGASMAQSASFAFIAFGILAISQAKYPIQLAWWRLALVMTTILITGLFLAPRWHVVPAVSLLMKFPIEIAVASFSAWVTAPDWCARGIKYIRWRATPELPIS
jgi:O-antigen/teichoic acid export membrane protein